MPVDREHPDYAANSHKWERCRDCLGGQDAIHEATTAYLPKLRDQSEEDYSAYLKRALFFNATQRTCEGLVGMVFRKGPMVKVPAAVEALLDDVTLTGMELSQFAQVCMTETMSVGRVGIMVDYPVVDQQPATVAQAEASGNRPFLTKYDAESIINWHSDRINGSMTLTLVVLKEKAEIAEDEFTNTQIDQLRVLDLSGGVYRARLYRREGAKEWTLFDSRIPLKGGTPLNYIPFIICGARTVSADVEKPPLLDMVDVNLSHYRTSADLEHGAHFCGLPTAVVSGYRPEKPGDKLYIGSAAAWVFPQPDARAGYLEFTGQGLGALSDLKKEKEGAMASLGARMLAPERREVEAAETAAIHRSGEVSVLATMAHTLSNAIELCLDWLVDWNGTPGEVEFDMNTDYFPMPLASADITALVGAWQQGAISKETLFYNLKRGELIPEKTTFEDEDAAIGDEPPALAQQLTTLDAQHQQTLEQPGAK